MTVSEHKRNTYDNELKWPVVRVYRFFFFSSSFCSIGAACFHHSAILFFRYSEWISVGRCVLCVGLGRWFILLLLLSLFVCCRLCAPMDIMPLHGTQHSMNDSFNSKWFLACAQLYEPPATNWDRWASRIPITIVDDVQRSQFARIARPSNAWTDRRGHWRYGVMIGSPNECFRPMLGTWPMCNCVVCALWPLPSECKCGCAVGWFSF